MKLTATKWRTVELLGFGTVLGLVIVTLSFFALTGEMDRAARERAESLVTNGIVGRVAEEAQLVVPQVLWDEAVAHVANDFDLDWVRSNFGEYLTQTSQQSLVFVLDGSGRVRFAEADGHEQTLDRYEAYRDRIAPLIESLRSQEEQRGPLPSRSVPQRRRLVGRAIQSSSLATVEGATYIVVAGLIQPDFGTETLRDGTAPILVTGKRFDRDFLANFARRFLLKDLQLSVVGPHRESGASVPLRDVAGVPVAWLNWTPEEPGTALRRRAAAPLLALLAAVGLLCAVLYRRGLKAAHELEVSQAQVDHASQHDSLTGLPNRVHFAHRLESAFSHMRRTRERIAIHHIDLDRFKEVNDRLGHHCGDELIVAAGKRIAENCRGSDTFARLGGDEFAVIQTPATPETARVLAERLVNALARPFELSGGHAAIGGSVGVTVLDHAPADATEALRQSDYALYHAKERGRGQFAFFSPEMDAAARAQLILTRELREAIQRGTVELSYQPRIETSGRVPGLEVKPCWKHPTRGMIETAELYSIAEDCGLCDELGLFTLKSAIEDAGRWGDLDVCIPLSTGQLRSRTLVTTLWQFTAQSDSDPYRFELMLTEDALASGDPDVLRSLRELSEMGFAFALDEFGSAGMRLDQLRKIPLHRVKLGRAFTRDLGDDPAADVLAAAVLKLGLAMRMRITADGIELPEQREKVIRLGYTELQGPLIAPPLPIEDLLGFLDEQRAYDSLHETREIDGTHG